MHKTTKPQGATSFKETSFGIIPRSKLLKLEIEGMKKGLEYILNLKNINQLDIDSILILKLHDVSFSWIFPDWAGKYRKIQVTFSGKEAPPYFQIPELMINLCNDLKERFKHLPENKNNDYIAEVVKLLAWFQHRFVFIHPFQDYNGRTARLLTLLILLKLGLPPIEIKADNNNNRKQYLTAMQKGDEGDFTLLENLIGQALIESLEKLS